MGIMNRFCCGLIIRYYLYSESPKPTSDVGFGFEGESINGASDVRCQVSGVNKLPNILNIYFPESAGWRTAKDLLIKLDLAGVAVSSGSACSTRSSKPSHVLKSCGLSENRIKSSLRFSLGRFTAKAEINEAIKRLKKIIGPVV